MPGRSASSTAAQPLRPTWAVRATTSVSRTRRRRSQYGRTASAQTYFSSAAARSGRSSRSRAAGSGPARETDRWARAWSEENARTRATPSPNVSPSRGAGVRKSAIHSRPSPARTSSAVTGSSASRRRYAGRWASSQARSPGCAATPACSNFRQAKVSANGEITNRLRASVSAFTCHQPMCSTPPHRRPPGRPPMPANRRSREASGLRLAGPVNRQVREPPGPGAAGAVERRSEVHRTREAPSVNRRAAPEHGAGGCRGPRAGPRSVPGPVGTGPGRDPARWWPETGRVRRPFASARNDNRPAPGPRRLRA